MVYLNSVLAFNHCPYCGKKIHTEEGIKPCKHLVAEFIFGSFSSDGCFYMSEKIRKKYYPNYVIDYTDDAVLTKTIGKAKIKQIVKENNYVEFDIRSKEAEDMYEWPILKLIFDEPEYC